MDETTSHLKQAVESLGAKQQALFNSWEAAVERALAGEVNDKDRALIDGATRHVEAIEHAVDNPPAPTWQPEV